MSAVTPREALAQAWAALDAAFGAEPPIDEVIGCGYCYTPAQLSSLGRDVAGLPDDLVRSFAWEPSDHWEEDQYGRLWRRLAPRIFRLVDDDSNIPDWLLRGLSYPWTGLPGWSPAQRAAVWQVCQAQLHHALTDGRPAEEVADLLGAFTAVDPDVSAWLSRVEGLTGPQAEAGFIRLISWWAVHRLVWDWNGWTFAPVGAESATEVVVGWLCGESVGRRLERFLVDHPGCKNAGDAVLAIDALRRGDWVWLYPGYGYEKARASGMAELTRSL